MVLFYPIRRSLGPSQARKGNRVSKPLPRRRPPKVDTEQMALKRASARHLKDLRRWHAGPPPDVKVNMRGIPKLVPPILEQSYCTSPAALCARPSGSNRSPPVCMTCRMCWACDDHLDPRQA